jgi:ribokinase
MSLAVFGSINVDITAYSRRLPRGGETIHGESYLIGLGGKGANQAAACARLGGTVHLIARTGSDIFANTAIDALEHFGVNTAHVAKCTDEATGIAIIGVDESGENVITVIGGANLSMTAKDAENARHALAAARVLLLQNEVPWPAAAAAARITRQAGGTVILDPAPAPVNGLSPQAYELVHILTPNESETEALTQIRPENEESCKSAAAALHQQGAQTVILKMGAKGLFISAPAIQMLMPAFAVHAIDTVAAGDCFNGGLAHALSGGADLATAARFAAACGALSTTRRGAAQSAPNLREAEAFLRQHGP